LTEKREQLTGILPAAIKLQLQPVKGHNFAQVTIEAALMRIMFFISC